MRTVVKILFIAPLPPPITGQSVAVQALYADLLADGHTVVSINLSKNTFRQGISSLGRVAEILQLIWQTWRAGRDFDCVYLTTAESVAGNLKDLLLLAVLGRLQSKTWLHLHGGAGMRELLSNRTGWTARLNAYFLRRVAGLIVLGERLAPIFNGYIEPERIRIVKNFAAESVFPAMSRIAEKWSDTSKLRVLFLSNLLPGKGYEELLQAIISLPPKVASRFTFDFAGGFETKADEARFLAAIAGRNSVHYHGTVHGEVKQELLAQAHVFCLPSYYPYEGQPISILEAYASGCVVFTTDHSGIFDIFTPDKNGWEVFPRNPTSIIDALTELAALPERGAEVAGANRRDADQLYTRLHHLRNIYSILGLEGKA